MKSGPALPERYGRLLIVAAALLLSAGAAVLAGVDRCLGQDDEQALLSNSSRYWFPPKQPPRDRDHTHAIGAKRSPRSGDRNTRGGATHRPACGPGDADLHSLSYGHLVGDSTGPARRGSRERRRSGARPDGLATAQPRLPRKGGEWAAPVRHTRGSRRAGVGAGRRRSRFTPHAAASCSWPLCCSAGSIQGSGGTSVWRDQYLTWRPEPYGHGILGRWQ